MANLKAKDHDGNPVYLSATGAGTDGDPLITRTNLATLISGEDQTNDVLRIEQQYQYETVGPSQTDQVLGATGAAGDLLHALHIVSINNVTCIVKIKDGAGSDITVQTNAPTDKNPRLVLLDIVSISGAWKVSTGSGVSVIAIGRFT